LTPDSLQFLPMLRIHPSHMHFVPYTQTSNSLKPSDKFECPIVAIRIWYIYYE